MGTISSGVGLISGLDIQALVQQLVAIESRPLEAVNQRITQSQQRQQAYLGLSANLLAVKGALQRFSRPSAFLARTAASGNEDVLTATAATGAPVGSFQFTVKQLVGTHTVSSRGFADRNSTPVGAGKLTFETGRANLSPAISLSSLNGGEGVRRGIIAITDRSGAEAEIDLRTATELKDVLSAINSAAGVRVRAYADGDHIRLVDESGGTGVLTVSDRSGGFAAADLGIAGTTAGTETELIGTQIHRLSDRTRLSALNDGAGVDFNRNEADLKFILGGGDVIDVNFSPNLRFDMKLAELNDGQGVRQGVIKITNRDGESAEVDLTTATTLQEVADAVAAAGIDVTVSLAGSKITLTDGSTGTISPLKVEDVSGNAAADLGILREVENNALTGSAIHRMDTLGAVMRAVQYASGNENNALTVTLSADGTGLVFNDTTGGPVGPTIQALNGSNALRDLGIATGFTGATANSRALLGGLNTVLLSSLRGGAGIGTGQVDFTLRDGTQVSTDFSTAKSLQDIIDEINEQGGGALQASLTQGGTGIKLTDTTLGTGQLQATDVSGTTAADLGFAASSTNQLVSGDLQLRYVSEATRLADLNFGKGINAGRFRITASTGASAAISISDSTHKTVGDVIRSINNLGLGVTASINSNGDGIDLVDTAGGATALKVVDETGATAKDLRFVGTADIDTNTLSGSFAATIDIDADDTLDEVARKINDAGVGVRATVLFTGDGYEPYSLSVVSSTTGAPGKIAFPGDIGGLDFQTLSEARDAKVVFGDPNSVKPGLRKRSSNTVQNVVDGVTLNLVSVSDKPVDVSIDRDVDTMVEDIKAMVEAYNGTLDQIDELTRFVPDTNERGILLGDGTILQIQGRLRNEMSRRLTDPTLEIRSPIDVGLNAGTGARLSFDEETFRAAFEEDADAVKDFFTKLETTDDDEIVNVGFAPRLAAVIDDLADRFDGTLTRASERVGERIELFTRRAENLQVLLDGKEARLFAQFQAMERALAGLQGQQSALASLANLASSFSSGGGQGLSLGVR